MHITLPDSKIEVELKDRLNWGEDQHYGKELSKSLEGKDGADWDKFLEVKYLLIGMVVLEIKNPEGASVKFSKEWMNALSKDDGEGLYEACLTARKKKSSVSISPSNSGDDTSQAS